MAEYKVYLAHGGKKGMKWGYNDGKRNGKRVASEKDEETIGVKNSSRLPVVKTQATTTKKSTASGLLDRVKDWAGVDEKEAYERAKRSGIDIRKEVTKAAYDKTLMSKVDAVASTGKKVADSVKGTLDKISDSVTSKAAEIGASIFSKLKFGSSKKETPTATNKTSRLGDLEKRRGTSK